MAKFLMLLASNVALASGGMFLFVGFAESRSSETPDPTDPERNPALKYHGLLRVSVQQPFAFNHRLHKEEGVACLECHTFADRSQRAGIPTLEHCMKCHAKGKETPGAAVKRPESPVPFNHAVHLEDEDTECSSCHELEEGADLPAFPTAEVCYDCHEDEEEEEGVKGEVITKVKEALDAERELPWVRSKRLDGTIVFSHRDHGEDEQVECAECHAEVLDRTAPPETVDPVEMKACTECHTEREAVLSCTACHGEEDRGAESDRAAVLKAFRDLEAVQVSGGISWVRYYHQPPDAYFSHRAHVSREKVKCEECHGPIGDTETPPQWMMIHTMESCIHCHEDRGVTNDCQACHK
ncbi:MAG: cytochrome c3 family protein [Planctomycetota bacterium]